MKTSTKAFTLIELLIVVIVLGILAGIAVPRYARVLENRKASEAEEILSAVRTEQEARCIAGKPYLTESRRADLTTLAGAGKSQNYTYTLASKAIVAKRDVKNGYTLMMPYKSGQICCMGNGCSGLNKDYPGCPSEFGADECEADADYIEQKEADHGCVCYDKNGVERGAGYVESQSCSYGPVQTHTC
ncbi:MAG: type II secretion system protein, partial [Elusimicrobiaceae bacterium]|nr:type II secretion system protein [Elusimicrobiaceae bacterium]